MKKFCPPCSQNDTKDHSNKEIYHSKMVFVMRAQRWKKYNQIDWKEREFKFKKFLEKYRSRNGSYDFFVPGSGGKKLVFQAQILKKKYQIKKVTFTFSPHIYTDVGMKNFHNWPLKILMFQTICLHQVEEFIQRLRVLLLKICYIHFNHLYLVREIWLHILQKNSKSL